jgi:RNA polymerase sigma-70 factor (sigma-E family)
VEPVVDPMTVGAEAPVLEVVTDPPASPPPDFAAFYAREFAGAVRLAALLTQAPSAAEDLAQDAFARMIPKWESAANPAAYLRTSVVNACFQWQRHAGVRRAKAHLVAGPDSIDFAAGELADAVAALPDRQRAVLVLRYYADLSEAEIADALGCRPGTVKSLASRALARLQEEIDR